MSVKKEIKIGVISVIVLLAIFWGFNFLKGKDIFKLSDEYHIMYKKVNGLLESNAVMINGYAVGQVKAIDFNPNSPKHLFVTIEINPDVKIPYGTVAQISSIDLLGSKGIELILGNSSVMYNEFDTIPGVEEIPLLSKLDPLEKKAQVILQSIDSIVNSVKMLLNKDMIDKLSKTLQNFENLSGNLAQQNQTINHTLLNLESITDNLNKNNKAINQTLSNLSAITDTIKTSEIKQVISQLNITLFKTTQLLDSIQKQNGTIGKLIEDDSLYENLNNTLENLDRLLIDLKQNPKNYLHFSVFGKK